MMKGIDISAHNWQYLASRDFYDLHAADFVIMKASEGITFKDGRVDTYYNLLHGMPDGRPDPSKCYGFYHYARPERNAAYNEANHFLDLVFHHAGHAVFALDVEGAALQLPKDYLDDWVNEWAFHVYNQTGGVTPMIYCSQSATGRFKQAAQFDCGLWCASWGSRKPTKKQIAPWQLMAIWQNGTTNGHLDTDIFYGDAEAWHKYCERGE